MDLRTSDLAIVHDSVEALGGVSLSIPSGTHALVLGPHASGKTTLLKALAGLHRPTRGQVFWGQKDVVHLPPAERRERQAAFGMVFQTDALFDSMTVLDNAMLPLVRRDVPRDRAREKAEAVVAAVGLAHVKGLRPESLSGGMRRRAGLARALVAHPEVILADDPFAGLDPSTALHMAELLKQIASPRTLLISMPEPERFLDFPRWIVLTRGQLVYDGPPTPERLEALDDPTTP